MWDKDQPRAIAAFLMACLTIFIGTRYLIGISGLISSENADIISYIIALGGMVGIRLLVISEIVEELPKTD